MSETDDDLHDVDKIKPPVGEKVYTVSVAGITGWLTWDGRHFRNDDGSQCGYLPKLWSYSEGQEP